MGQIDRGFRQKSSKIHKLKTQNKIKMLKVFADRMSQPSRAVIIFCKVNGIEFEEIKVDLAKGQHLSPDFKDVNPMRKVPAIADGRFYLFESHAILIYLACSFPGVVDSWYPADLSKRAKIHSVLDWHHSNLRAGAAGFVFNSTLAPLLGRPLNLQAAAAAEKLLASSLSRIESFWLKGSGKFLAGSSQPSIADLSLACEIMQLELVDEEDRKRILGPHEKVQKWIEDTRKATSPHFDEVQSPHSCEDKVAEAEITEIKDVNRMMYFECQILRNECFGYLYLNVGHFGCLSLTWHYLYIVF